MKKLFGCAVAVLFWGGCGLPAGKLLVTERHQESLSVASPRLGAECTDTLECCPEKYLSCYGNPDEQIRCECRLWACDEPGSGAERCWRSLPQPFGGTTAECTWTEFAYVCEGVGEEAPPDGGGAWACDTDPEGQAWRCEALFPPNPLDAPEGAGDYSCEPDGEFQRLVCTGPEPEPTSGPDAEGGSGCPYGLESCELSNPAVNVAGKTGTGVRRAGGSGAGSAAGFSGRPATSGGSDGASRPTTTTSGPGW